MLFCFLVLTKHSATEPYLHPSTFFSEVMLTTDGVHLDISDMHHKLIVFILYFSRRPFFPCLAVPESLLNVLP